MQGNLSGRTGGDRTRDPNIKSVVLYQLSYSPRGFHGSFESAAKWWAIVDSNH